MVLYDKKNRRLEDIFFSLWFIEKKKEHHVWRECLEDRFYDKEGVELWEQYGLCSKREGTDPSGSDEDGNRDCYTKPGCGDGHG